MNRVSTNMSRLDAQYHMMMRESKLNDMENKISTQSKIKDLRDDPIAASHTVKYQSKLVRLERFVRNIDDVKANLSFAEVKLQGSLDVMQRVRELAVQGANGVYTPEDLKAIGREVDQLLEELVSLGNSQNGMGNMIFGGYESKHEPFRILRGRVENGDGDQILEVEYRGDIGRNNVDVSEESVAAMNLPGNYVFWAENQSVYSNVDATSYQVQEDSVIRIDGVDIPLQAGDNINTVIARINDAPIAAKASLDPVKNSLVLQTTTAHQLWAEDVGTGTVFQDLGVLRNGAGQPPGNFAQTANVYGGSVFDTVIALRDSLLKGDSEGVNRALGGMDLSVESLTSHLAEIGAVSSRVEGIAKRLEYEIPELTQINSNEIDLDYAEAITEMKMLEYTHEAALSTASSILRPTLLDFMR